MRRSFVISVMACSLALAPAALYAQDPPAQPAAPQTPPPPKVPITTPAGILLVTIKADQTAVFEEMVAKINAGLAKTQDATLKQQAASMKIYKAAEPSPTKNALYVVVADPVVAKADYDLFQILFNVLTDDEKRSPEFKPMWDKYVAAFAGGLSRLSLTPIAK